MRKIALSALCAMLPMTAAANDAFCGTYQVVDSNTSACDGCILTVNHVGPGEYEILSDASWSALAEGGANGEANGAFGPLSPVHANERFTGQYQIQSDGRLHVVMSMRGQENENLLFECIDGD